MGQVMTVILSWKAVILRVMMRNYQNQITAFLTQCSDSSDDESGEEMSDNPSPLYFLYDCEGTGGSVYKDHIVEIAAVLQPLPSNLHVKTKLPTTFQSLVNTSKRIAAPGKKLNI